MFLTSKLITCFIGGFPLKTKSQSIVYLLNRSEDMNWILDLNDEVYSIWDLWINDLQECKDNDFFEVGRASNNFQSGLEYLETLDGQLPLPESTSPKQFALWFPPQHRGSPSLRPQRPKPGVWAIVTRVSYPFIQKVGRSRHFPPMRYFQY